MRSTLCRNKTGGASTRLGPAGLRQRQGLAPLKRRANLVGLIERAELDRVAAEEAIERQIQFVRPSGSER
jgi:hypothetical protein